MPKNKEQKMCTPTVLVILDGFGLRDTKAVGNAITSETAPNIFSYMKKYPTAKIKAHGHHVGLFKGQAGNSEAGHFNIGAGRVVKQDLVTISEAVEDGTFFKNEALKQGLYHVKKYNTKVHIMGLLTDGNSAHATPEHLYATLEFFRKNKCKDVYIHLFTDGRDAPPHSAVSYIRELEKFMKNGEKIVSICGRFYAMDRNKNWDRTKKAYDLLVSGKGICAAKNPEDAISQAYNRGETDEYICPTIISENGKPVRVEDNDLVVFYNTRSDRARQLTKAFVQKDFNKKNPGSFKRSYIPKNTRFVALTDFGPDLDGVFTAFPTADIKNSLPCVIDNHCKQLYISESEKYAHVTFFINGGYADAICGEKRDVVSSKVIESFAKKPAMSAKKITKKIIDAVEKQDYTFVVVNYPNADMVGHTGNFEATKKAVSIMDQEIKKLVDVMLSLGGQVLITADHGNAEEMLDKKTGEMMTEHTTNPVPCILIKKGSQNIKFKKSGQLSDIAPTVLKMLGLKKPKEMTGKSLY